MPSIKVVPTGDTSRVGYNQVQSAFGAGAPGALQIVTPAARGAAGSQPPSTPTLASPPSCRPSLMRRQARADPGRARHRASDPAVGQTIDRLRSSLPGGTLVGGAVAENHDLEARSRATPLVIGVVLTLGFALLLIALQAP